jgi:hypothetical protein
MGLPDRLQCVPQSWRPDARRVAKGSISSLDDNADTRKNALKGFPLGSSLNLLKFLN